MNTAAFIIGIIILGASIVVSAFLIVSALSVSAGDKKSGGSVSLQQPMLSFFTEYDAADYLGVSLNELDFMRLNGMLKGSYMAYITLEQTGEEEYIDIIDGVEVTKTRPVRSNVTRYIYNRDVLDKCVLELMSKETTIDTTERKQKQKKNKQAKKENPIVVTGSDDYNSDVDTDSGDEEQFFYENGMKQAEIVIEKNI